ncbi:MAG: TVP38/TMEM64 family protein [Gammaproteobacteria bacterium]
METDHTSQSSATGIKFLILFIFVAGLIAFFALGGDQWLTLEALKAQRNSLLNFTEAHYLATLLGAVLIYTAAVALSIPGAIILSLAVGLMFGRWVGTAVIVFSATLGATLVFLAARYLFADTVQKRIGGLAKRFIDGFNENAFNYLLFLRIIPVFPFWLVNLAVSALTPIGLRTYVLATFIGIIPGSFIFANLGQSLGRINSIGELLSPQIIGAFALLGLFALTPLLIKKIRGAKSAHAPGQNSP